MGIDRRGFLRFLGMGAAAAVAAPIVKPKSFFFFDSAKVWKPESVWTYELQGSTDLVNWTRHFDAPMFKVQPISGGIWDGLMVLLKVDILDVGGCVELPQRYLRVVCTGGQMDEAQKFSVRPIT
jgi:hypothetical protein